MRSVVIKTGVYGRRDEKGRVLPVAKGERVKLPDAEAARLVALNVAAYADAPMQAPDTPPGGEEELEVSRDTHGSDPAAEAPAGGGEDGPAGEKAARLERMKKADLERMAQDMDVDISGARNNRERAELLAAASGEGGGTPPEPDDEDIVL